MSIIPIDLRPADLFAHTLSLHAWIVRSLSHHSFERAQTRAYRTFAERYPIWADSLFDQHFLRHVAAPLIARCLHPEVHPVAEEFVLAWWSQFSKQTIGPRELSAALPAATAFLHILDAELGFSPTLKGGSSASATIRSEVPANPSALLVAALHESSNIEMDWLWVAKRLVDPIEQCYCYQRALYINPDSEEARKGLARL